MTTDLSVIDVQRALREHADWGHDVTQHPRETIIRGKPYAARLGAVLRLTNIGDVSTLSSKLMQSERPVLAHISTHLGTERNDPYFDTFKSLWITPQYPIVDTKKESDKTYHRFGHGVDGSNHERHTYDQQNFFKNGKISPKRRQTFHVENDVHDVLNRIATDKHPYFGTHIHFPEDGGDPSFTPIEHGNHKVFDLQKALTREFPHTPPMSGLIAVHSPAFEGDRDRTRIHVYDPQTEQLMRVE